MRPAAGSVWGHPDKSGWSTFDMCATSRQQVGSVPWRNALSQATNVAVGTEVNPG